MCVCEWRPSPPARALSRIRVMTGHWLVITAPGLVPVRVGVGFEHEKGIRWMPWHQEAMKDVARCEKPRGAASRR